MNAALPINQYLALNHGRYSRETLEIPRYQSNLYVTTHLETADTDLPHYHSSAHLSFILSGAVIDRRNFAEAERSIGDLMFFRAGEIHQSIYCRFPAKNINIELESEFFEKNSVSETYLQNTAVKAGHAKFTLLRIYNEMLRYDRYSPSSIEMLLLSLTTGNDAPRTFPKWLNRVVDLLNDSWNEDLSVNEIASAVNVHPKTVSKYFSRYVGCTLGEYRRQLKVERSLSLIRATDEPLTDIAQTCGFYDQSHFSGSFRRLTGFLPKHFRRL